MIWFKKIIFFLSTIFSFSSYAMPQTNKNQSPFADLCVQIPKNIYTKCTPLTPGKFPHKSICCSQSSPETVQEFFNSINNYPETIDLTNDVSPSHVNNPSTSRRVPNESICCLQSSSSLENSVSSDSRESTNLTNDVPLSNPLIFPLDYVTFPMWYCDQCEKSNFIISEEENEQKQIEMREEKDPESSNKNIKNLRKNRSRDLNFTDRELLMNRFRKYQRTL